jgi:hypothetical protein
VIDSLAATLIAYSFCRDHRDRYRLASRRVVYEPAAGGAGSPAA